ncbi:hypothetical protein ES705_41863 [subsurface metagenome]
MVEKETYQAMLSPEVVKGIERRLRELNPVPKPKYTECDSRELAYRNKCYRNWCIKHPDRAKRIQEKYNSSEQGREMRSIRKGRRRVLQLSCEGFHTTREWLDRKEQYGFRCAYCHKKLKRLTKDHIVPLSRGGTNYIYNIVPACRSCNGSKGNQDILAWDKFNGLQQVMSFN